MRYRPASAFIALCAGVLGTGLAAAGPVTPPQGYIGVAQDFGAVAAQKGAPKSFYNVDYGLRINSPLANHHGTFWSNQFNFLNSSGGLPANHSGGDQGGYYGVQALPEGGQMAIVSIWWALDAKEAGAGAKCLGGCQRCGTPTIARSSRRSPTRPSPIRAARWTAVRSAAAACR